MIDVLVGRYVRVRGRYHRSVQVGRDWHDEATLATYVATPSVHDLALRIAGSLLSRFESRAWSLTGPFGSGKSAFAVFLTDVLARSEPIHPAARAVRQAAQLRVAPLLPVVIVGRRTSLAPAMIAALSDAVRAIDPGFAERIEAKRERDAEQLWKLFEEATNVVRNAGYSGLFVIIDELGKFLEHASLHPGSDELFVLQYLAEGAARLPDRMLLVTIQHLAFADYLQGASQIQVAEWRKIHGRFTDVAFHRSRRTRRLLEASVGRDALSTHNPESSPEHS